MMQSTLRPPCMQADKKEGSPADGDAQMAASSTHACVARACQLVREPQQVIRLPPSVRSGFSIAEVGCNKPLPVGHIRTLHGLQGLYATQQLSLGVFTSSKELAFLHHCNPVDECHP